MGLLVSAAFVQAAKAISPQMKGRSDFLMSVSINCSSVVIVNCQYNFSLTNVRNKCR